LVFQLYGRPLHPELFEGLQFADPSSGATTRRRSTSRVPVTCVTWRYAALTLTRCAPPRITRFPNGDGCCSYRLKAAHDGLECRGGVRYQVSFQLEPSSRRFSGLPAGHVVGQPAAGHVSTSSTPAAAWPWEALSYINVETAAAACSSSFPHLPRRLRHRQEPVADPNTAERILIERGQALFAKPMRFRENAEPVFIVSGVYGQVSKAIASRSHHGGSRDEASGSPESGRERLAPVSGGRPGHPASTAGRPGRNGAEEWPVSAARAAATCSRELRTRSVAPSYEVPEILRLTWPPEPRYLAVARTRSHFLKHRHTKGRPATIGAQAARRHERPEAHGRRERKKLQRMLTTNK